ARAVDQPDAMPAPAGRAGGRGAERGGGPLQEPVEQRQGESLAGLAVGAVGEGPLAEVDDVGAGGVAVEDLEHEEPDGGGRVEDAVAPGVVDVTAALLDGLSGDRGGDVLAQSAEDGDDTRRHGRAPSSTCGSSLTTQAARSPSRAQEAVRRSVARSYC